MIRFENTKISGFEEAVRGMRNPLNSWDRIDSHYCGTEQDDDETLCKFMPRDSNYIYAHYVLGPNDFDLMKKLAAAGSDHAKFRRMIVVYTDIIAPLYWWKEYDTYKVGTVANSCSTMHTIHKKEFTASDFSCDHLLGPTDYEHDSDVLSAVAVDGDKAYFTPRGFMTMTCNVLNHFRKLYLETGDKKYWWQIIQLLPSSYNQRRTVMLNYEVLSNMYRARKNHKLDEWHMFCDWIRELPYADGIIFSEGTKDEDKDS